MARIKAKHGKLIKHAILMAEDLFPDPKSGKEKREWVVDFLNKHVVNLPILSERREEQMIRWVIDCFCDVIFDQIEKKS